MGGGNIFFCCLDDDFSPNAPTTKKDFVVVVVVDDDNVMVVVATMMSLSWMCPHPCCPCWVISSRVPFHSIRIGVNDARASTECKDSFFFYENLILQLLHLRLRHLIYYVPPLSFPADYFQLCLVLNNINVLLCHAIA